MKKNKNRMSHSKRGRDSRSVLAIRIKRRTTILFSLAAIIPVIICGYIIIRFIHPEVSRAEELISVVFIVLSLLFIAIALVRELIINVSPVERLPKSSNLSKIAKQLAYEAAVLEQGVGIQERAYRELVATKGYVESIAGSLKSSLITMKEDHTIAWINRATTNLLGYEEEELIGKHIKVIFSPSEEYLLADAKNFRTVENCELNYISKSGKAVPVNFSSVSLIDAKGKAIGLVVTAEDMREKKELVWELKKAKENLEKKVEERTVELAQAKDFQENIISSMADSLIIFDADEKIREVNRETEKLLGYSQAQLRKMKIGDILTDITTEEYNNFIASPNKAEDLTYEIKYRTHSGDKIPVSVKRSVLYNNEGDLIGILIIARDIREYLLAEARMREANKMTALGQFAAGTAHEINNPLSIISGNAQYLLGRLQEMKVSKERVDFLVIKEVIDGLSMVYQHSLRCSSIVQRLLAFARGASEILEKRKMAISLVLKETVAVLQPQFKLANVKMVMEQPLGEQFMVYGNSSQLQQVFMNILLNAREAMNKGGTISLAATTERASNDRNYICFNITDAGSGITSEVLPKVFEPFFTTKKPMGTGLGLSVAYSIVREHEGDIHLISPAGKGTTVTVRLPLC